MISLIFNRMMLFEYSYLWFIDAFFWVSVTDSKEGTLNRRQSRRGSTIMGSIVEYIIVKYWDFYFS